MITPTKPGPTIHPSASSRPKPTPTPAEDLPIRSAPRPATRLGGQGRAHQLRSADRLAPCARADRPQNNHPIRPQNNGNGALPLPPGEGRGEDVVAPPRQQSFLFEHPTENPPIRDAVEFYQHQHNWSNRLVAGDSLLVMNSLLEKEGMAGKVQMVYIDPPYGIRYGSNFQPFVNRRDVKDGSDEDLTQEPETIRPSATPGSSASTAISPTSATASSWPASYCTKADRSSCRSVMRIASRTSTMDEMFGTSNFARLPFGKRP